MMRTTNKTKTMVIVNVRVEERRLLKFYQIAESFFCVQKDSSVNMMSVYSRKSLLSVSPTCAWCPILLSLSLSLSLSQSFHFYFTLHSRGTTRLTVYMRSFWFLNATLLWLLWMREWERGKVWCSLSIQCQPNFLLSHAYLFKQSCLLRVRSKSFLEIRSLTLEVFLPNIYLRERGRNW